MSPVSIKHYDFTLSSTLVSYLLCPTIVSCILKLKRLACALSRIFITWGKMRVLSFAVLAFLVIWPRLCHSARILMLSPVATKSHKISVMPVLQALAQQGHLVTILTSHQPEESVKNVHEIVVHNPYMNDGKFDWFTLNSVNPLLLQYYILNNFATVSKFNYEAMMNNTEFKSLLRKREVDLVILDDSFNDFCLKVIEDLQVPFIFFSSSTGYPWVFSAMGATQELSSVPSRFTGYDNDMSFKERLFNTLAGLGALWLRTLIVVPAIDDYTKKDFPKARSISEIEKDASLYFLSCQWTTTWPRPLPPTVILLGPLHIHSPRPLPRVKKFLCGSCNIYSCHDKLTHFLLLLRQEIENMIGKSEDNGCIIFTLGSIPSSKFMPEKHIQTFVKVFSMIPQQVIWKWDDSTHIPDNVSENVHLVNWLPQQDLLGLICSFYV